GITYRGSKAAARHAPWFNLLPVDQLHGILHLLGCSMDQLTCCIEFTIRLPAEMRPVVNLDPWAEPVQHPAVRREDIRKLQVGRSRISTGVTIDDKKAICISQRLKQALPPFHQLCKRHRIDRVDPVVSVKERTLFEGILLANLTFWRYIGAEHNGDLELVLILRNIDYLTDFLQIIRVVRSHRIWNRFQHRPYQYVIIPQFLHTVQVSFPIFQRPCTCSVWMVVRPMLVHIDSK